MTPQRRWKRLSGKHPRFAALAIGMIMAGGFLLALEAIFFALDAALPEKRRDRANATVLTSDSKWEQRDDSLGHKLLPGASAKVTRIRPRDQKEIYSVRYTIDAGGRRLTPEIPGQDKDRTALFFGGSYTLGEGLQNDETIPYFFMKESESCRALNYGVHGYGSNHVLAILRETPPGALVPPENEKPVALYIFIDDHIRRSIGSQHVVNHFGVNFPCWVLDEDGKLIRNGSFRTGRPIRTRLYAYLNKSHTLRFFNFDWPPRGFGSSLDLTARIIDEARQQFLEVTGSDLFFVVFYPGSENAAAMAKRLDDLGTRYLDYSQLWKWGAPGMNIEGEGHPSAEANRILGSRLAKDIDGILR